MHTSRVRPDAMLSHAMLHLPLFCVGADWIASRLAALVPPPFDDEHEVRSQIMQYI